MPMTAEEVQTLRDHLDEYALNEYELELASEIPSQGLKQQPSHKKQPIYIKTTKEGLEYQVVNKAGEHIKHKFNWSELPTDFPKKDRELIKLRGTNSDYYYYHLDQLLKKTLERGDTYEETADEAHNRVRNLLGTEIDNKEEHPLYQTSIINQPRLALHTAWSTLKRPHHGHHRKMKPNLENEQSARNEFIDTVVELDNKTNNVNQIPFKKSITMKELLGTDGLKQFQLAMAEEAHSPNFRDAVFLSSTQHFEGQRWNKKLAAIVTAPTGAGKTQVTKEAVEQIEKSGGVEPDLTDTEKKGNDVVYIDASFEREISQVRQYAKDLALRKGYTYISDLDNYTHYQIKAQIEEAAKKNNMNIVAPITCANPVDRWEYKKFIKDYAKKDDRFLAVLNVETPRDTNIYQGKNRTEFQNPGMKVPMQANHRHLNFDSKEFKSENISNGIEGSNNLAHNIFDEEELLLNENLVYLSAKNDRTLYKSITLDDGSKDWKEYSLDEKISLVHLPPGLEIDNAILEQARNNNTPILIQRGEGKFSIYGFQGEDWKETDLLLHDEISLPPKKSDRENALAFREKLSKPLLKIFKKHQVPPDGSLHESAKRINDSLAQVIKLGHSPKITAFSKKIFEKWCEYKRNNYQDKINHLPGNIQSPQEWLKAYQKRVPTQSTIEIALKDRILIKDSTQASLAAPRSEEDGLVEACASFDKSNIEDAMLDKLNFFNLIRAKPDSNLEQWAKKLLKNSGNDPALFLHEFYEKAAQLAFTNQGRVQPWLIKAIGKSFASTDENGWFEGDEILRGVLANKSQFEILDLISGVMKNLLWHTFKTVSADDSKLSSTWQTLKTTIKPNVSLDQNFCLDVKKLEDLSHEPLPNAELERQLTALLQVSRRKMTQLLFNSPTPPFDTLSSSNTINTFIDQVKAARKNILFSDETTSPKITSSRSTGLGPSSPLAGLKSDDEPSTSSALLPKTTWSLTLNQGRANEISADFEERSTQRGKTPSTTSLITKLSGNLDTARAWANDIKGLFPKITDPHSFFSDILKKIREKDGLISAQSLGKALKEKLGDDINAQDLDQLTSTLYKKYINRTEQMDAQGRRFACDAFIAIVRNHVDAHIKNCKASGIDPPVFYVSKECFDSHYLDTLGCVLATHKDKLELKYDKEGGWDYHPPSQERVEAFKVLYEARGFKKMDERKELEEAALAPDSPAAATSPPSASL